LILRLNFSQVKTGYTFQNLAPGPQLRPMVASIAREALAGKMSRGSPSDHSSFAELGCLVRMNDQIRIT
jgi:hypothetical protein